MARGMGNNIHRVRDGDFEYLAVAINGHYYRLRCIGKWGNCNGPFSPKWNFEAWPRYA